MTTTNTLAPILDRKVWEMMTPSPSGNTVAGVTVIEAGKRDPHQLKMVVYSATTQLLYFPKEDAWILLASAALGGTFGAGTCGEWNPKGPSGTATAGSVTSMTTNLTLPGSIAGYKFRVLAGAGAGQVITVTRNTIGANAVLYFDAVATALDATSVYELMTGRFYVWNAVTMSATSFKCYDVALGTWNALSVTGVPASWNVDGQLAGSQFNWDSPLASGTATAGGASTLTNSAKAWTTNQWVNAQIRLTGGTGAGQIRTIASNTGTVITVSVAWATQPDATTTYVIEGNEDYLYLMGNNAVTLYRYSINGNTWTTLAPGVARAAAPTQAATLHWVAAETDATWTNENAIINGRRLYSFRGGNTNTLDYYDIAANAWTNNVTYNRQGETFNTGSSAAYVNGAIYLQKDATGRFFRFDPELNALRPFSTLLYFQSTAVVGNKLFSATFTDGATELTWVYFLLNSSNVLFRCLIIE